MTPKYKVIVSERARQMLGNHIRFLAQKNPTAARKLNHEILGAIRSLYHFPERFPFLEVEFVPYNKYHKLFIERRYLLLYQVKDRIVYVDYIIDCRQDYTWLLH